MEKKTAVYCAMAQFPNTMESVAFFELYKTFTFFYTTETARNRACQVTLKRCKKKGIGVTFKYITKQTEAVEAGENTND